MYDLVKRKHDQTPTPEKRSNRSSIHKQQDQREETEEEEDDEEEDDEEDDDEEDEDEDEDEDDGDGEEEKDYKGYQLRQRRPIPNRYIAPPLKTCSRGLFEFPCLHAPRSKVIIDKCNYCNSACFITFDKKFGLYVFRKERYHPLANYQKTGETTKATQVCFSSETDAKTQTQSNQHELIYILFW